MAFKRAEIAELYLLLVNDVDAGFDIGKRMAGGENGLALVLLMQVSVCAAI